MTQWNREYAARFERLPASEECRRLMCVCTECPRPHVGWCLTVGWATNDGPYDITVYHLGFEQSFHENVYREGPSHGGFLNAEVDAFLRAGHEVIADASQVMVHGSLVDVA